jgi:hypothetical protein
MKAKSAFSDVVRSWTASKEKAFTVPWRLVLLGAILVSALASCAKKEVFDLVAAQQADKQGEPIGFVALAVGTSVAADGNVVPLTVFTTSNKIIASVRTKGAGVGTVVAVRLIEMSNGSVVGARKQVRDLAGSSSVNIEFSQRSPWIVGRYLVEASVNGKLEARQEIEVAAAVKEDGP